MNTVNMPLLEPDIVHILGTKLASLSKSNLLFAIVRKSTICTHCNIRIRLSLQLAIKTQKVNCDPNKCSSSFCIKLSSENIQNVGLAVRPNLHTAVSLVTGGMHTGGKHTGKKHIRLLAHPDTCTLGYLHIRGFAHLVTCTLRALHTELCRELRPRTYTLMRSGTVSYHSAKLQTFAQWPSNKTKCN